MLQEKKLLHIFKLFKFTQKTLVSGRFKDNAMLVENRCVEFVADISEEIPTKTDCHKQTSLKTLPKNNMPSLEQGAASLLCTSLTPTTKTLSVPQRALGAETFAMVNKWLMSPSR